jgi:hypothetical protein
MQVNGVLKRISEKSGTSAKGPWTAYSICVGPEGNNDNDTWYRAGFKAPKVNEGSVVTFEADENGQVKGAIAVDKSATAKVAKTASAPPGSDARQNSIVRQNATTTASRVARDMIECGAFDLPKTKSKRYDAYLELVNELANHFFPTLINPPSLEELAEDGVEAADEGPTEEEMWEDA